MGKKDKKDATKVEAKKARQALKQQKADVKRSKKEVREGNEVDLDAIIADYIAKEAKKTAVTVTTCEQPSRRANFSMTALTGGDMLLFGGETCDGETITVFNELFRWNLEKNEWKQIESLNTPPPRCSHQTVLYNDKLYMFGGEYATMDQFHHYKDLWEFNVKTNTWSEITATGDLPSARSGHRMVVWRNYIILYGGFYEAMREVRWFDDLYFFSLQDYRWTNVSFKAHTQRPKARSGLLMFLHGSDDTLYLFGGYSKQKEGSKQEGKIHEDMWALSLKGCLGHRNSTIDFDKLNWQKVSKKGDYPTPRCGSAVSIFKNKALVFGGVYDFEGPRHSLVSTFYDDLFAFDMDRRRWYKLGLKPRKDANSKSNRKQKKSADPNISEEDALAANDDSDSESDDEVVATEDSRMNMFGYIDETGEVVYLSMEDDDAQQTTITDAIISTESTNVDDDLRKVTAEEELTSSVSQIQISPAVTKSVAIENISMDTKPKFAGDIKAFFDSLDQPCARINPCLMMRGNSLLIYGGATELGDTEVTLDDAWSLDINKRESWKKILPGTMSGIVWKAVADDMDSISHNTGDSSDDDDDDDDDDDEDEEDYDSDVSASNTDKHQRSTTVQKPKTNKISGRRAEMEELRNHFDTTEEHRTPKNGESLRQFYARTSEFWTSEAIRVWTSQDESKKDKPMSEKEFKREGFLLSEIRYAELLPLLTRLNELENDQKNEEEDDETNLAFKKKSKSSRR